MKTTFLCFFLKISPSPLGLKMEVVIRILASIQESHMSKPKQFVLYKVGKWDLHSKLSSRMKPKPCY